MMWEYECIRIDDDFGRQSLKDMGSVGWELAAIEKGMGYFKRPKMPKLPWDGPSEEGSKILARQGFDWQARRHGTVKIEGDEAQAIVKELADYFFDLAPYEDLRELIKRARRLVEQQEEG